jgi:hypothetical protein
MKLILHLTLFASTAICFSQVSGNIGYTQGKMLKLSTRPSDIMLANTIAEPSCHAS